MKATVPTLALILACMAAAAAQTAKPAQLNWSDSTRDIYINAELDRSAQMIYNDTTRQYALISPKLARAVILDTAQQTVSTAAKESFRFAPDKAAASSDAAIASQPAGKYTLIDNSMYLFAIDGKPVLIRSHTGLTGEISPDALFATVPVWHSLMESYQPEASTVAMLNAQDGEAQLTIVLGSWCPDSKNFVPKLLKSLWAAGNDKLKVKLVGVDSQFHEPITTIQGRSIINVPTVIVERQGREIGRIVETPAASTMEEDLVAILNGKPNAHMGRWDRGPEIARGVYAYREAGGKQSGTEAWELYSNAEGGHLLHSKVTRGDLIVDVWHRIDAARKPTFVEVTRHRADEVIRTRYRFNAQNVTARLRGTGPGVIEQTISVPERFAFLSPIVAAEGWAQASLAGGQKQTIGYVAPYEFDQTVGTLMTVSYELRGEETIRVPAGQLRAKHFARKSEKGASDWWFHSELAIPVQGKTASGTEFVLTALEVKANGK
jgi:hypothetical protein